MCQRVPTSEKDRAQHLREHNVALVKFSRKQAEHRPAVPAHGSVERDEEKRRIAQSIIPYILDVMDSARNYKYSYDHDRLVLFIEAVLDYLPQELADLPREALSQEDLTFILSGISAAEHSGMRTKFASSSNIGKTWALLFMAKMYVDSALDFFNVEKHELTDADLDEMTVGNHESSDEE